MPRIIGERASSVGNGSRQGFPGVTGFLSDRIGLIWEARYFSSVGDRKARGFSFGAEQLSFWRASMGLVIRY